MARETVCPVTFPLGCVFHRLWGHLSFLRRNGRGLPDCKRILVVKLSSLGDVVHVTPCLRALRQSYPNAEIIMAVEPQFAAVVLHNPHIYTLIESRFTGPGSFFLRVLQLVRDFHRTKIDLAIDFQGNQKSAAWIYGSRSTVKAGRGGMR